MCNRQCVFFPIYTFVNKIPGLPAAWTEHSAASKGWMSETRQLDQRLIVQAPCITFRDALFEYHSRIPNHLRYNTCIYNSLVTTRLRLNTLQTDAGRCHLDRPTACAGVRTALPDRAALTFEHIQAVEPVFHFQGLSQRGWIPSNLLYVQAFSKIAYYSLCVRHMVLCPT